jgi:phosphoglycerate dehydrogenase-like enzyme
MNASAVDLLIFEPSYRRLAGDIRAIAPGIRVTCMNERAELLADDKPIAIEAVTSTAAWPNLDVFAWAGRRDYFRALLKIPTLKWVQSAAAGVDDAVFGRLAAKGVTLTNSDTQAPAIADYVLGAALDFFQEGDERRRLQAASDWRKLGFRELADTTWLIVGYGRIGREVARRAHAFGATLIGLRRDAHPDEFTREVATLDRLAELLPRADVVVLATGLNEATREMANAAFFARMKAQSLFVNVGRGGLVDEGALLAALDLGTPARATLDVFQTEPLPGESPLWHHPRVRLSSHTSALGSGNARRSDALFLDNLGRFVRGEPLRNVVKAIDLPKT